MDQETVDTNSLTDIARALISPALLIHKERGVKAYTACALVDILRLYAPEAPYTGAELKVRFSRSSLPCASLTLSPPPGHLSIPLHPAQVPQQRKGTSFRRILLPHRIIFQRQIHRPHLRPRRRGRTHDRNLQAVLRRHQVSRVAIFDQIPLADLVALYHFSSESPKNVEICMTEILLALIEEAATLTSEVIDILLAQFLPRNAVRPFFRPPYRR